MKVGRIKDPLYEDDYLGISHLPSSHLLRPSETQDHAFVTQPGAQVTDGNSRPDSVGLRGLGV